MNKIFSFVICTYNRSSILKECLESILSDKKYFSKFDIIVVNNNSTDNTEEVVRLFINRYPNVFIFNEKRIGLSYARNTGYIEAKTEWIIYIDDDTKISETYIQRFIHIISNYEFDVVGGSCRPWYKYGKPKWFKDILFYNSFTEPQILQQLKIGFVNGYNCAFRRSALEEIGGFNSELGMSGKDIGYGEETLAQIKLREKKKKIWYDPELIVYHLVLPHKLKLIWHLKASYINGTHHWKTFNVKPSIKYSIFLLITGCYNTSVKSIKVLPKLLSANYYIQNYLLEVFVDFWRTIGILIGSLKKL